MSVTTETNAAGRRSYSVRWRHGGRNRARRFNRRKDAVAFNARVTGARQLGELHLLDASETTVEAYAAEYWDRHVVRLARGTQTVYGVALRRITAELGGLDLREVRPSTVMTMVDRLRAAGVGEPSILKTLTTLQGMFRRAVLEDLVASNPVPQVDKPSQRRTREPKLVPPAKVEEMRAWLLNNPHRRYARDRQLDATLLSLLAYAGLRPESEALALRWEDVRERVLFVPAGRKRGARDRTVRLLAPLRDDLEAWRRIVEADGSGHIFGEWSGERWDGWRGRVYREAARVAELPADARPRDLRGSFASLLIAEGQSVLEVARQLGHSPATCLRDYAALFDDFDPAVRVDPEGEVRRARRAARWSPSYSLGTQVGA
jgi:integrase